MSVWPLRYRHGQTTVEAFRWTGDDSQREEPKWVVEALQARTMRIKDPGKRVRLEVLTPSGWATASSGDWIVRWPSNTFEVCSDKLFAKRCAAASRRPLARNAGRRRDRPDLSRPSALPSTGDQPTESGARPPRS
jgi:hypothetical protein